MRKIVNKNTVMLAAAMAAGYYVGRNYDLSLTLGIRKAVK